MCCTTTVFAQGHICPCRRTQWAQIAYRCRASLVGLVLHKCLQCNAQSLTTCDWIILLQDRPSSSSAAQGTKAWDAQSNIEKLFIVFFCRKHLSFVYILQEDDGTPIGSKECDVLFTGCDIVHVVVKAMEPLHARKIWWQEIREERLWFVRMSWRLL